MKFLLQRNPRRALMMCSAALTLAACGGGPPMDRDRPNVIVVVVDSLRADHLGAYGDDGGFSPQLDAFAENATLYERAIAPSPSCLPSHASLLTGTLPSAHGVHRYLTPDGELVEMPLQKEHVTLAEAFQEMGYDTGAFLANVNALADANLEQGFSRYHARDESAAAKNRRIRGWIDNRDEPFFLMVNYTDTRRPYLVRRTGWRFYEKIDTERPWQALADAVAGGSGGQAGMFAEEVVGYYDRAIANVDRSAGELLAWLRSQGLFDNTIIVITSDHGEAFGRHGIVGHGNGLYEDLLRVPLFVKFAGQRVGATYDRAVSTAALARLLLDEVPASSEANLRDQFPARSETAPVFAENYYAPIEVFHDPPHGSRYNRVCAAVYEWPWKFIAGSDDQTELYNLRDDPQERNNLAASDHNTVYRLQRELRSRNLPRAAVVDLSELQAEDGQ